MLKQYFFRLFTTAHDLNVRNITYLANSYSAHFSDACDLGAGDGLTTQKIATQFSDARMHVVESYAPNVDILRNLGYSVHVGDLNSTLPLANESFDLVVSNQVIEHLYDTDVILRESFRILRPGGVAVFSTENLASWHNIVPLLFGWQPFSLTNITAERGGIGNPLAFFSGAEGACFPMQHHRLMTTRTLRELLSVHGFSNIRARGAGYHPFPASFGILDSTHAHFIAVSGQKPMSPRK